MTRDTFGPLRPQVIQHESGLYYTYKGRTPHVELDHAIRFREAGLAQLVVNLINTSGRGRYAVVEVQS